MRVVLFVLLVASACKINLDKSTTQPDGSASGMMCQMGSADTCQNVQPMLSSLQTNIFDGQCTFSGCHNGGNTDAGKIDLRDGMAYAHLVGATSYLEPSRKLVVASDTAASYLEVMVGKIAPSDASPPAGPIQADIGLMPMDNAGALLCCQKLDAIDMWIAAGAMNN